MPAWRHSTGSCGLRAPVFYIRSRRYGGSGKDLISQRKCVNERVFRKSLKRSREKFLGSIIYECTGLTRKISQRTSGLMNSVLSGQKVNDGPTRRPTRKGLPYDGPYAN